MILYENNFYGIPDFYSVYSAGNLSWPLHLHLYYECISVARGSATVVAGQRSYALAQGDTAFICLNQLHSICSSGSSEIVILQFSPDLVGYFTRFCRGLFPANPILTGVPIDPKEFRTDNIFRQKELLYRLCRLLTQATEFQPQPFSVSDPQPGRAFPTGSGLESGLRMPSSGAAARSGNAVRPPAGQTILRIFNYVGEHFHEECNLKKLSEDLGYDYSYLSRAFRSTVQLTFTQYLNQYRIHRACLLLRDTEQNISDIAYQCGYESLRSFNRNFRAVMGTAPGKWRAQDGAGP